MVQNSFLLFSFLFFFFKILLSAGRMSFFFFKSEEKEDNHYPFFESKLGPIMLRNILGPSFDATSDQVLTQPF